MFNKRKDAYYCYDVTNYMRIFPFIMKRRCDSMVFYEIEYDITNLVGFVKEYNKQHKQEFDEYNGSHDDRKFPLRLTTAILIAYARLLAIRPKLNRFIANKKLWQRKEISQVFIVKKSFTEEAPELSEELVFDVFGSFDSYVQQIESYIDRCQTSDIDELNANDMVVGAVLKYLPKWLLSLVLSFFGMKDRHDGVGKWLHKADCLHSSAFTANLSSLGISDSAPHHHLYEWGTTSFFTILGPVKRIRALSADGKASHKDSIKISFTVDERICDGFYFLKSLKVLGDFLFEPEKLLHVPAPEEIPHLMTKKEYKQSLKARKKELLEKKKARSA
ncbi:MAG TPA: hypothetical protein DCO86_05430 [Spirochaetaceae bacterium]|nr:hypothetical protein [Spirochaetaceae bacterium]